MNPRLEFHALGMHGTVCVNESLHQNDITGLEPTRQTVHGATFDVRKNGRSVRVNVGMLPLGVDKNLVNLEPSLRFKMVAACLIGAEHRPTNAGFRTLCFQQDLARSFSGELLGSSYTEQDRGAPPRSDQTRASSGISAQDNRLHGVDGDQRFCVDATRAMSQLVTPSDRLPRAHLTRPSDRCRRTDSTVATPRPRGLGELAEHHFSFDRSPVQRLFGLG
jgi:hypothetical protein